jgi:cytochrome P450
MWAVHVLADRSDLAAGLRDGGEREGERFIAELLRLFPPVPFVTRHSRAAHGVGAERFAAGEPLAISFVGLHCDPGHWSRPLEFLPERDEWARGAPPPASYFPFSIGARVCGGMKIARAELRAGLRALVSTFEIQAGPSPSVFSYGLSLRPITDAVLVERRRS